MNRKLLILAGFFIFASIPDCSAQTTREVFRSQKQSLFNRNILWEIIDNCLENNDTAAYCKKCPSPLLPLLTKCKDVADWDPVTVCRNTAQVWAKNAEFVAIRDYKMCGCPADFVHGLALPRRKVTGAEDPRRPSGLWKFAWDEALQKIDDPENIMLTVNPRFFRTQDQLHVHFIRLAPGARRKLLDLKPVRIKDLDKTWEAAERHAAPAKLEEGLHGVAAIYDTVSEEFLVVTAIDSVEKKYSVYSCKSPK